MRDFVKLNMDSNNIKSNEKPCDIINDSQTNDNANKLELLDSSWQNSNEEDENKRNETQTPPPRPFAISQKSLNQKAPIFDD